MSECERKLTAGKPADRPLIELRPEGSSVDSAIGQSTCAQVNENAAENATPGERLSGVVGVGQAEFEGEPEGRTYGIEYALAASNDSKAEVVKERLEATRPASLTSRPRRPNSTTLARTARWARANTTPA